jgi:hypothetical protein
LFSAYRLNNGSYLSNIIPFGRKKEIGQFLFEATKQPLFNLPIIWDIVRSYKKINKSEENEQSYAHKAIYDLVYSGYLPSIVPYCLFGLEIQNHGLLTIKAHLEKSPNSQTILEFLNEMPYDNAMVPTVVDNVLASKLSHNIDKIGKNKLLHDEHDNLFLIMMFKVLLPITFAKEAYYQGYDKPDFIVGIDEHNVESVSAEIDYSNIIPHIESERKFNFLDR